MPLIPRRMRLTRVEEKRRTVELGGKTYELIWGDLHRHTNLSKCKSANDGDIVGNYRWALDAERLDFYAITEHLEYMSYGEWKRCKDSASLFSRDEFLGLYAFELAKPPGHINFFYREQSLGEELRICALESKDLEELWLKLDGNFPRGEIIAARHHQGHNQLDVVKSFAPEFEPVMEIIQTRGEFREFVEKFLSAGCRVGFVGVTDHSRNWALTFCLTGVWVAGLSSSALFHAVRSRTCYASNTRIVLFTSMEDVPMGGSVELRSNPSLRVHAEGTGVIELVQVFRNGELVAELPQNSKKVGFEWLDRSPPAGLNYYYVRVQERVGLKRGVAYSSPIWAELKFH